MGKRVLLVDEEPSVRAALEELVSSLEHEAVLASDGAEALEKLAQEPFDLCVTELHPALVDSVTLIEAARQSQPPVPVVVLTGEGTAKDVVNALRAGAIDFVSKPFH